MATSRVMTNRVGSVKLTFEDRAAPRALLETVRGAFSGAIVEDKSHYGYSIFGMTVNFGEDQAKWPKKADVEAALEKIKSDTDFKLEQYINEQRVNIPGQAYLANN